MQFFLVRHPKGEVCNFLDVLTILHSCCCCLTTLVSEMVYFEMQISTSDCRNVWKIIFIIASTRGRWQFGLFCGYFQLHRSNSQHCWQQYEIIIKLHVEYDLSQPISHWSIAEFLRQIESFDTYRSSFRDGILDALFRTAHWSFWDLRSDDRDFEIHSRRRWKECEISKWVKAKTRIVDNRQNICDSDDSVWSCWTFISTFFRSLHSFNGKSLLLYCYQDMQLKEKSFWSEFVRSRLAENRNWFWFWDWVEVETTAEEVK